MNEDKRFQIGQKVKISKNAGWQQNFMGTVAFLMPEMSFLIDWKGEFFRKVRVRYRELTFVWVDFDEPQFDGDGDDKYTAGEIDTHYLRAIES